MPFHQLPPSYKCPVCHLAEGTLHHAREMMLGTGEVFPYWECKSCGCLSLTDLPAAFSKYYPSKSYYSLQVRSRRHLRKLRDRLYLSRAGFLVNWRPRTDLDVIRRIPLRKSMTLLDIGCGGGQLIADLRELGYNATGVDPFVSADIVDRFGVRVERKMLGDVNNTYDVLLFRHSLEHMPLDALQIARRRMKHNGMCVVCIPLIGWAWRHYHTNWAQLDAPRHLFLHSRKSFETLANASGFRVERVVYDSNEFQFWASECYQRNVPLTHASPPGLMKTMRMRRRATALNRGGLGDAAQFYLRPIE